MRLYAHCCRCADFRWNRWPVCRRSRSREGLSSNRIVDEFTTGQISAGHTFTFCVNWIPTISNWSWKAASWSCSGAG